MNNSIFLSVKDLMLLVGGNNIRSAQRMHRVIRDSLGTDKRKLTIKEYCKYEQLNFDEIWFALRESHPNSLLKTNRNETQKLSSKN